MREQLYVGIVRNGEWFNYAEVEDIKASGLSLLDSADTTSGGRLLKLLETSVKNVYTEMGTEYKLQKKDYFDFCVVDGWKISRMVMRQIIKKDKLVFPEYFFCRICSSSSGIERYTKIEEDWDDLIKDGQIEEIYLEKKDQMLYEVDLPDGVTIESSATLLGGNFKKIVRRYLNIGDLIDINKSNEAMQNEIAQMNAFWDATIEDVPGMSKREFDIFVRRWKKEHFCRKYITSQDDHEAMFQAEIDNRVGMHPTYRNIRCEYCHADLSERMDFTNFFQPLLPNISNQNRI